MAEMPFLEVTGNAIDPALEQMFETATRYDATCILNHTLTEYTIWMVLIGIAMGIIFTLLFQYVRRKTKEHIEKSELEEKLKELRDHIDQE